MNQTPFQTRRKKKKRSNLLANKLSSLEWASFVIAFGLRAFARVLAVVGLGVGCGLGAC